MKSINYLFAGFFLSLAIQMSPSFANQMRVFQQILSPQNALDGAPEGSFLPEQVEDVPTEDVSDAVQSLADDWNSSDMDKHIGEGFFDKQRLSQSMMSQVPRDARLKLESVRGVQTNNQYIAPDANGNPQRISTVTVTARTRIEMNESGSSFLNVPGTNEITFQVIETLD